MVFGQQALRKSTKKYNQARKPIARFLKLAEDAAWPHFPAVKEGFPAADYAPETGTIIFDIAGNKYRLIARIDFEAQAFYIDKALTHAEYNREKL